MPFDLTNLLFTPCPENPAIRKINLSAFLAFHPLKHEAEMLLAHPAFEIIRHDNDVGGVIAGGVLRKLLLRNESLFNHPNGSETYFQQGGDIDLWFESARLFRGWERDAIESKKGRENLLGTFSRITPKEDVAEKNAKHYKIGFPFVEKDGLSRKNVTLQAVQSLFGKPVEILESFDIINSMIATDGKTLWIHERAMKLEANRTLSFNPDAVRSDRQRNLMYRALKYIKLHGYDSFDTENGSLQTLAEWCQTALNPEALKKYSEEDKAGFASQVLCMNQLLLTANETLIPSDKMYFFGGISKLPRYEPLTVTGARGIYRTASSDYVENGETDSAIAALLYREMVRVKGAAPKNESNIINALIERNAFNPLSYARYPGPNEKVIASALGGILGITAEKALDTARGTIFGYPPSLNELFDSIL